VRILEIARKLNVPDESYWCESLHREPGYVVLRYDVTQDTHLGPFVIPAGSLTIAHYREGVAHVLWEMYGPERALQGYCYHLSEPPVITNATVTYLDLLLDLWFDAAGNLTVLDQEEVEAAHAEGRLSDEQLASLEQERLRIERDHEQILRGLWRPAEGVKSL